jgi:DNA-binding HxlR family transcriptional regulator
MSWDGVSDTLCPVARGLSIFGERWTLLIMRELGMGSRRFDDIQAQTGMSSHLLSLRLKQLEADGVIERRLYLEKPKRYEYFKTEKGRELDSVLVAIRAWGMKWGEYAEGEAATVMTHKETGKLVGRELEILAQPGIFTFDSVDVVLTRAYISERKKRGEAFQRTKRHGSNSAAAQESKQEHRELKSAGARS